jgi:hypothetical protein
VSLPNLMEVFGNSEAAYGRLVLGQALVSGLVAATCTLRLLRMEHNRVLWSLVAGALPGLVLLGAERLTRGGGAEAVQLVYGSYPQSPASAQLLEALRQRHGLIVLAVGGLIALLVSALQALWSSTRRGRQRAGVEAFHQGLARIGLDAGEQYGFALAGGYAVQAAGFLERPSEDVDLFTVWERRGEFDDAARAIVDAYRAAGLSVEVERQHDTFTRLTVGDGVRAAKVELGLDSRAHAPVRAPIGPVLHPDDAVANKMRAICERVKACDFIDIDAVLRSGRYQRSMLLQLAQRSDITFDVSRFADALGQAQSLDAEHFTPYGIVGEDLDALRHRLALWRVELLDSSGLTR